MWAEKPKTPDEVPPQEEQQEQPIKPLYVEYDQSEPGHPGVTVWYSDGTASWKDARGTREWEINKKIPPEEWIGNLPTTKEMADTKIIEGMTTWAELQNFLKNEKSSFRYRLVRDDSSYPDIYGDKLAEAIQNNKELPGGPIENPFVQMIFDKGRELIEKEKEVETKPPEKMAEPEKIEPVKSEEQTTSEKETSFDGRLRQVKSWGEFTLLLNNHPDYFEVKIPGRETDYMTGKQLVKAVEENKPENLGVLMGSPKIKKMFEQGRILILSAALKNPENQEGTKVVFSQAENLEELYELIRRREKAQGKLKNSGGQELSAEELEGFIEDRRLSVVTNNEGLYDAARGIIERQEYLSSATSFKEFYDRIRAHYASGHIIKKSPDQGRERYYANAEELISLIDRGVYDGLTNRLKIRDTVIRLAKEEFARKNKPSLGERVKRLFS